MGHVLDGFMTTVLPATSAAMANAMGDAIGELWADMIAHTPTGLPLNVFASSSIPSTAAMRESTSWSASWRTIPVLTVTMAA